ncbi:peptide-methionine (S)-S-oxide reductase MsrA [Agriterribacter sp.]|uniref:peptide-methionine (S)-S-oxide reductase MsrA n=1 Tax=Agriterribacter sp. TaxID=2821509 RepID=UPI002BEB23B2|nr:peptide-methionine (S)-S-oxide reductase MsrA [Agriterribacter sp.]HTN06926.1 peptide-methionine (S)-S-oxide reductase MsrA [Agriterribacter sp.]
MKYLFLVLGMIPATALFSCGAKSSSQKTNNMSNDTTIHPAAITTDAHTATATFANGCFWCTEAVFQQLEGVTKVTSGYSGGHVVNPTYEQVCEKNTGHAEALQIVYDPTVITFEELLEVFWKTHDPTTLNRQGNDVGPQYRSVIFYHNNIQKEKAEAYKAELDKSGAWPNPIVTTIEPFKNFYVAENYHQNYYKLNGKAPYCQYVIRPKLEKFEKIFKDKLKKQ